MYAGFPRMLGMSLEQDVEEGDFGGGDTLGGVEDSVQTHVELVLNGCCAQIGQIRRPRLTAQLPQV